MIRRAQPMPDPSSPAPAAALRPAFDAELVKPYSAHRPTAGGVERGNSTAPSIDLFLDANEGAAPPREVMDALANLPGDTLRRYPNARPLEARLASVLRLPDASVLVTAGGDDALDRCCRAMLGPGLELLTPTPTFEMIPRYARLRGGTVIDVPWGRGAFPTQDIIERITPATRLIAVVTPNNPTGSVATEADLRRLSAAAPHAMLMVDLAYTEFADVDLTSTALSLPNAVIVRTFSKAFGLAGLRVGYAASSNAEVITWLRSVGNPYAASSVSLAMAARCLDLGFHHMRTYFEQVRRERAALAAMFAGFGANPYPSQANFVLAEVGNPAGFRAAMAERGIAIRAFPNVTGLERSVRVTCPGDPAAFARLSNALTESLSRSA